MLLEDCCSVTNHVTDST